MIRPLFEKQIIHAIIIAMSLAIVFFICYIIIDYVDFFNTYNSSIPDIIYNRHSLNIDSAISIVFPVIGLITLMMLILMPTYSKTRPQKILMNGIKIGFLLILYVTILCVTENKSYIFAKKESFLNKISIFYTQYPETNSIKEILYYLDNNDYRSISKMDLRKVQYTDALAMKNTVRQINSLELTKIYENSMKDGHINLIERDELDKQILKIKNEK